MNEKPSFYPKHLARQYVSSNRFDSRPKAEVRPLESPEKPKKDFFAPTITSSTVNLPFVNSQRTQSNDEESGKSEPNKSSSKVLSGLPESFVEAMRKLFNVMDTNKEGRIKFEGKIKISSVLIMFIQRF